MSIPEITPSALNERLPDEEVMLLDVRQPDERAIADLGGLLIPMQDVPERLDDLQPYRDRTLVVYCRSGARSAQVVQYLQAMGFRKATNLKGGLNAWSRDVDPTLPTY